MKPNIPLFAIRDLLKIDSKVMRTAVPLNRTTQCDFVISAFYAVSNIATAADVLSMASVWQVMMDR